MKIVFLGLEDWEQKIVEKDLANDEITFIKESLSDDSDFSKLADAEVISIFITSKVTAEMVKKMPRLKLIVTRSTGFDHIDTAACKAANIAVANIPSYGENTVAEHAFALILALSRKIIPSCEHTRLGNFELEDLRGFDLKGKTIGVIGTGKIGAHVARMANGFEMKILGYDQTKNPELQEKFDLKYVELEKLLEDSDIITLHLPLFKETEHLINASNIGKIKKGAYIINTSRGGLIDTTALAKALNEGNIAGAGLDVLEDEANIKEEIEMLFHKFSREAMVINMANNVLLHDPRVIITPHNAFNSKEALERIINTTVEDIIAFEKSSPINLV